MTTYKIVNCDGKRMNGGKDYTSKIEAQAAIALLISEHPYNNGYWLETKTI